MADVICDTSFVMHVVTDRIHNISDVGSQIGSLRFVIPDVVTGELERLCDDRVRAGTARAALRYCGRLPAIPITGRHADAAILEHVRARGGIVATLDRGLKSRIKAAGGSVISIHDDKLILEQ